MLLSTLTTAGALSPTEYIGQDKLSNFEEAVVFFLMLGHYEVNSLVRPFRNASRPRLTAKIDLKENKNNFQLKMLITYE